MSRSESRLISSQTSNWISTRTEPCSVLFWAMAADWVGIGAGAGTKRLGFAVSIRSALFYFLERERARSEAPRGPKAATGRPSFYVYCPRNGAGWAGG